MLNDDSYDDSFKYKKVYFFRFVFFNKLIYIILRVPLEGAIILKNNRACLECR